MGGRGISNKKEKERVAKILEKAGIPLELRVARLCSDFCKSHKAAAQIHIDAENIVYSPTQQNYDEVTYREIDQQVTIYHEFKVSSFSGIQLSVNLPIECKFRENISYFAFPSTSQDVLTKFPIGGHLAGSEYFSSLFESFKPLRKLPVATIAQVEEKKGTICNIAKEELLYKAGGALYDFINYELSNDAKYTLSPEEIIPLFKGWPTLQTALKRGHWYKVHQMMEKIDTNKCKLYNKNRFGKHCVHQSVQAYLPVICINGPLYSVKLDANCRIKGFKKLPHIVTSMRKKSWPGLARFVLLDRTPVLPTVVTNLTGLNTILQMGFNWFTKIKETLSNQPAQILQKWAIESAIRSYYWQKKKTAPFDSRFYHLEDGELDGYFKLV